MPTTDPHAVVRWLGSLLREDLTLKALLKGGVHYQKAATGSALYPYIVYGVQSSGPDVNGGGGCRVQSNPLYRVLVYGKPGESLLELTSVLATADELLQGAHHTTEPPSPEMHWWVTRETEVELPVDRPEGIQWQVGGLYRIEVLHPIGGN